MSERPLFKRISIKVFDNPFFRGRKFTENEARIYLYALAYDDFEGKYRMVIVNGNYVKIYPGEVAHGTRKLAEIFGWDKKRVGRFYIKMQEFGELTIRTKKPVTIVKLAHYVPRLNRIDYAEDTDQEQLYNKHKKQNK